MVCAHPQQPVQDPPAVKVVPLPKGEVEVLVPLPPQAAPEPTFDDVYQATMASFRPLLISELRFIRKACGLSEAELKPIVRDAACLAKKLSTTLAKDELKRRKNTGKVVPEGKMEVRAEPADPFTPILKDLTETVRGHVTSAQWARFQAESLERRAHRRRVAIANMVAQLDYQLLLSDDQRTRLSTSLAAHWDDSWTMFVLVTSDNDNQQFPPVPNSCVAPFLTESQKALWLRSAKHPPDGFAGRAQVATDLSGERESEFDSELGKPRVEPGEVRLGDIHVD
jgi:hypothetical protein